MFTKLQMKNAIVFTRIYLLHSSLIASIFACGLVNINLHRLELTQHEQSLSNI